MSSLLTLGFSQLIAATMNNVTRGMNWMPIVSNRSPLLSQHSLKFHFINPQCACAKGLRYLPVCDCGSLIPRLSSHTTTTKSREGESLDTLCPPYTTLHMLEWREGEGGTCQVKRPTSTKAAAHLWPSQDQAYMWRGRHHGQEVWSSGYGGGGGYEGSVRGLLWGVPVYQFTLTVIQSS